MKQRWHVCIPGWGSSVFVWHDFQRAVLPLERTIYLPWQFFSGDKEAREGVLTFLRERDAPILLYGWSMGAIAATELALALPDRVDGMFLLSPTARFLSDDEYSGVPARLVQRMKQKIETHTEQVLRDFASKMLLPCVDEKELEGFVDYGLSLGPETLMAGLEYLQRTDLRERLGEITVPTMILQGDEDRIVPMESAVWMADKLENDHLEICEGAGHHLLHCATAEIIQFAREFHRVFED